MAKKLFIIGNGFDRAHGLPTSYEDFREFLCEEYGIGGQEMDSAFLVPEVYMEPRGDLACDEREAAVFLVQIISAAEPEEGYWSDLEASLGRLDYSEAFDGLPEELDEDGDVDQWKMVYNNENMAETLFVVVPYIKFFFADWVDSIVFCGVEKKDGFSGLLGEDTLFLTFNYTETLERCYDIKEENICHIHGKQGQEIMFGHGDAADHTDDYMRDYIGSENALGELDAFLRKDTSTALKKNAAFFGRLDPEIEEVYAVGFSFNDVDMVYVKEICGRLSERVVWYLEAFDQQKHPDFQKKIQECGFRGRFGVFSV